MFNHYRCLKMKLINQVIVFTLLVLSSNLFAKDKISIGNGVALDLSVKGQFKKFLAEASRNNTASSLWEDEYTYIYAHKQCISSQISSDNTIVTDKKKIVKSYNKLKNDLLKLDSYFEKVRQKKMSRKYFLRAKSYSERARKILESINWDLQSVLALNELRILRGCYFLYHGGLNSIGKARKNYIHEAYKYEQRALKFQAVGLNENLSKVASLIKGKSKKGEKRRIKAPAFSNNVKLKFNVGSDVGQKEYKRLNSSTERLLDLNSICTCIKDTSKRNNYCSLLENKRLSEDIEHIELTQLLLNKYMPDKGKLELSEHPELQKSVNYLEVNANKLIDINKTLYKLSLEKLRSLSKAGNFESLMCITDLYTNNSYLSNDSN